MPAYEVYTSSVDETRRLNTILQERARQRRLQREGRFKATPAETYLPEEGTPILDGDRLAMLMEEVGEVAKAVLELTQLVANDEGDYVDRATGNEALRKELVQTAAVVLAWLENVEGRTT